MIPWQNFAPVSVDLTEQWEDVKHAPHVYKGYVMLQIPVFSVTGVAWKNASEIVHEFTYNPSNPFTIRIPITPPPYRDMVLAVRWTDINFSTSNIASV